MEHSMSISATFRKSLIGAAGGLYALLTLGSVVAAPMAIKDTPLFLNQSAAPLNMLVLSRDHRLYYEAYNDASDLNNDGILDVGYKPTQIDYYGYFESKQCYSYSGGIFVPGGATAADKTCTGSAQWSGDWLNYMTTSRIDALRKVLYGGTRYLDTATDNGTVLQRAYIPQDAHSWGKEYCRGNTDYDITLYTPLPQPTGSGTTRCHLFANTSVASDSDETGLANTALNGIPAPKFRVVESRNNRVWDWLSKERPVAHTSIIGADTSAPSITDYIVRVRVCSSGSYDAASSSNNCKLYSSGFAKPTGLLQDYGETNSMYFGLLTGSYGKPHDGGVLRKKMDPSGSISSEMNLANGTFIYNQSPPGIISTIDRMRVTSFDRGGGYSYGCGWVTSSSDSAGTCSMWGNPTAEMMYESLRYFGGKTGPTSAFYTGADSAEETELGLQRATWDSSTNPYRAVGGFPNCAKPFQTVISDINPSYDSDSLPGSSFSSFSGDLTGMNVATAGTTIWNYDVGSSGNYFIGQSGVTYDGAPTVKTVSSFGNIRGLAPEAPAKEGSYYAGSVAYYGNITDLSSAAGRQKVQTFAVALASPLPKIEIPVNGKKITLVPFAKSVGGAGWGISATQGSYQPTNQIVDFYVDSLDATHGKFRVNFEDVEQGADHDMDAIVIYEYTVNADNTVTVTLTSEYAAGSITQHMGYVISGTTADRSYLVVRDIPDNAADAAADPNYYLDYPNDNASLPYGTANPVSLKFTPGATAAASFLKDPLWYAAKWGGFQDTNNNSLPDQRSEWAANAADDDMDPDPDNYFLVTSALTLRAQLAKAFNDILDRSGSASAASVSSGSISDDTRVYQATFDARFWAGHLTAYPVGTGAGGTTEGALGGAVWDAASQVPTAANRKILTMLPTPAAGTTGIMRTGAAFRWASLGTTRQGQLQPSDTSGSARLDYLRGVRTGEQPLGTFRRRTAVLGDMINSEPVFVGPPPWRYSDSLEASPYSTFAIANANRQKVVYAGSNDGMMHAFNAVTGAELFAYVPHGVFRNLVKLTEPSYSHLYYADGTPTIVDAFYGSAWHTVLVAGLNKGGQSIYALDVTDPATVSESTTSRVLWEFTDLEDRDLGYTYSRPAVVKLQSGQWAAIFGNGYNNTEDSGGEAAATRSTTGYAALYVVDIQTGALIKKISVPVGSVGTPNGLATPAVIDQNGDGRADTVYAGDLRGNMWKFNLQSSDPTVWDIAFTVSSVKQPLFVATDASGNTQPITERPQVGRGPNGQGWVVLFGTGKFLESNDRVIPSPQRTQTFYGVFDRNTGAATDIVLRSSLLAQTVLQDTTYTYTNTAGDTLTVPVRLTSNNTRTAAHRGWYIDLVSVPFGYQGEMQVTNPVLRNGRIIFTTLIPDADVCAYGGRSWLMDMDALSGSRLTYSPFDLNRDSQYNSTDYVMLGGVLVPVSGRGSDSILTTPAFLAGTLGDYAVTSSSGSDANDNTVNSEGSNSGPSGRGRQSWRQLR
jgi:type IV pilus assembly protein PilY1